MSATSDTRHQRTLRILYHHRILADDGMRVHLNQIVTALRERGHTVELVGPSPSVRGAVAAGLLAKARRALPESVAELLELLYNGIAYLRLRRAMFTFRPDILYERYNLFLLAGSWLSKRYHIPMLLEVNAPLCDERARYTGLFWRRLAQWCERRVWSQADVTLPVSGPLREILVAAGVEPARSVVIPNAVEATHREHGSQRIEERKRLGLEDRLVLGFCGFIRDWHGLEWATEVLAEDGHALNLHLLVVGDGPARAALEARAAELGVDDRLTCVGSVPHERVPDYVSVFDIALQPRATAYASPLKLLEYMGLGCAIVAPDQPNIRELVRDQHSALLFDADSRESFKSAVRRLCRNADLRQTIQAGARQEIVRAGRTWQDNARKIETLAIHLLDRPAVGLRDALAPTLATSETSSATGQ